MKSAFLSLLTAGLLLAGAAQAQNKPALNTAPPGAPTPQPTQPQPATPAPSAPAPTTPPPSADRPSGLDLPSRQDTRAAGGGPSELMSKLFLYSNFGLGYQSYQDYSQFNFSIAPAIGYRVSERFAVGPGISYAYNSYSFSPGPTLTTSNIGVKAFAQFIFYNELFVHAEYEVTRAELLEVDNSGYLTGKTVHKTSSTPLAGLGYRNQFSDRVAADILLLYNFQSRYNSIYSNPVYRVSLLFNLGR